MFKKQLKALICSNIKLKHTWIKPDGYDTKVSIYNCVAKQNVPLIVANKHHTTWYTCGPTVYDSAHIGHASCYVKLDIIQRILRQHFDLNIVSIMNITDIDDKIIKESKQRNTSTTDLAKHYEKEFWQDVSDLGIKKPDKVVCVTENMPVIIDFIRNLIEDGKAYNAKDGSVYFDVDAYEGSYGKLQNIGEVKGDTGVKKSVADFALWKKAKEDEVFWESAFGNGRPGWHIECSALAGTILGSSIDIHAGGIDLRFPHHENEEAQSCSYFDKTQWVNYWIHTGHLHLRDSEKMSKSLKNTVSIQEMLKSCKADVFRMACLMSHYRNGMEFSDELLKNAENHLNSYKNFVGECYSYINGQYGGEINNDLLLKQLLQTIEEVNAALINDFDTSSSVKSINSLMSFTNKMLHSSGDQIKLKNSSVLIAVLNYVGSMYGSFGVDLKLNEVPSEAGSDLSDIMDILVQFRQEIRAIGIGDKNNDLLKLCDSVREQIRGCGFDLKDRGKVSTWSR